MHGVDGGGTGGAGGILSGGRDALAQMCPNADFTLDYNCPLGPTYLIPGLTDLNGWNQPSHYQNILVGDLDGDGQDELVVRGVGGIQVYRFNKTLGQWTQVLVNPPILSDQSGVNAPQYYQTLRLGDLDADGKPELVARTSQGIWVFQFTPGPTPDTGTWTQLTSSGPMADSNCFSNGKCWGDDASYYATIQLADIDGSGRAALVGRGGDGLEAYQWTGSGWSRSPASQSSATPTIGPSPSIIKRCSMPRWRPACWGRSSWRAPPTACMSIGTCQRPRGAEPAARGSI
jgi:hypothetical protein